MLRSFVQQNSICHSLILFFLWKFIAAPMGTTGLAGPSRSWWSQFCLVPVTVGGQRVLLGGNMKV